MPAVERACRVAITNIVGIESPCLFTLRFFRSLLELLRWWRGHWSIENRLHYVRDVTMKEDASQVRSGAAPQVMAAVRNAVLGLLRQTGASNIAAALRHYSYKPLEALALLGIPAP